MLLITCLSVTLLTIIMCSFLEWYIHGGLMHGLSEKSMLRTTHDEHHWHYAKTGYKNLDHGLYVHLPWYAAASIIGMMALIGLTLSYFTNHWEIALCVTLTSTAYYYLFQYIHTCMHVPLREGQWISEWVIGTRVFKFLDNWHRMHHRVHEKSFIGPINICLILPLADVVMGTRLKSK